MFLRRSCESRIRRTLVGRDCVHTVARAPCLKTIPRTAICLPLHKRWSSATSKQGAEEQPPTKAKKRSITTYLNNLDPTKFTHSDVVDLSGIAYCRVSASGDTGGRTMMPYKILGASGGPEHINLPFPPGTKGIFYFNDRTSVHPVAGDIRFRILSVDNAQDWSSLNNTDLFSKGHDLLDYKGFAPWRTSLLSIVYRKRTVLYGFMKLHGHISAAAEAEVERFRIALATSRKSARGGKGQVLDRFIDPFIIDLSAIGETVTFLTREGIEAYRLRIRQITVAWSPQAGHIPPAHYSGTALVRYELIQQGGQSRVVLRVLKFLKPPNSSDPRVQEEGTLLKIFDPIMNVEKVWMAGRRTQFITPSSMKLLEETYLPKSTI